MGEVAVRKEGKKVKRPTVSTVLTFFSLGIIVWCLITMLLGCRLANEIAWTMNKGMPTTSQQLPWLGGQQIMPVPIPTPPQKEIDWVGIAGIVGVQVLTWWLGVRDRRKFHGGKK